MTIFDKIRKLYSVPENENFGYAESELKELEMRLNISLPQKFKSYYQTLGLNKRINNSHNRLLKPATEVGFSNDRYLVFYEENQVAVYWGIKEEDLILENPPVYGNYGTNENPDWQIEGKTIEDFFLLMAIYNGTLGGLKYNANSFESVNFELVNNIKDNWVEISEISWEQQKVYTHNFNQVLSLSFDENENCTAIFYGTEEQDQFDLLLENYNIDWSYTSYDEEFEDEEL